MGTPVKCKKCNSIIESKSVHDFVSCKCGAIFVDGGNDYLRVGGNPEDILIWSIDKQEFIPQSQPKKYSSITLSYKDKNKLFKSIKESIKEVVENLLDPSNENNSDCWSTDDNSEHDICREEVPLYCSYVWKELNKWLKTLKEPK